jgi:mRNA interferase RelE/StbE
MEVLFTNAFKKSIEKIRDKKLAEKVEAVILKVKQAGQLDEIENLKKLSGFKKYYRIRIGDFRIGIIYENNSITFAVFANRKDIYKYFP